ncbi:hypothetical protein [Azospirillum himalayense]|uniref:hypothetical protein n=1 Tax=Azospirillum himalayense TaxID=654847 RepID=UPI0036714878
MELAGEISIRNGVARIVFVGDDPQGGGQSAMTPKLRVILPIKGLFDLHNAIGDLARRLEAAGSSGPDTAGSASSTVPAPLVSTPPIEKMPIPASIPSGSTPADAAGRSPNFMGALRE